MTKHGPIIVVPFENRIADTRPWNICGCAECEPTRLAWVEFFKRQHDTLLAEKGEAKDDSRSSETDDELRSFEALGESHSQYGNPQLMNRI